MGIELAPYPALLHALGAFNFALERSGAAHNADRQARSLFKSWAQLLALRATQAEASPGW